MFQQRHLYLVRQIKSLRAERQLAVLLPKPPLSQPGEGQMLVLRQFYCRVRDLCQRNQLHNLRKLKGFRPERLDWPVLLSKQLLLLRRCRCLHLVLQTALWVPHVHQPEHLHPLRQLQELRDRFRQVCLQGRVFQGHRHIRVRPLHDFTFQLRGLHQPFLLHRVRLWFRHEPSELCHSNLRHLYRESYRMS